MPVRNWPPRSRNSVDTQHHVRGVEVIPTPVRWLFLAFILTIPFGGSDWGFLTGYSSIPKVVGVLFFGFYLLYYGPLTKARSFPAIPMAGWWFLMYAAFVVLGGFFAEEEYFVDFFVLSTSLAQLLVLFWVASQLLKDEKMARSVLLSFLIGSALFAAVLQIPGMSQVQEGRVTGLGDNANGVAANMALALVIIMGLHIYVPSKHSLRNFALLLLSLPLFGLLVGTGSRTAILALVLGSLVYWIPHARSRWVLSGILGIVLLAATVYTIANSPTFMDRWRATYYEGDLSGRQDLYAISAEMILEKPMLGWHSVEWLYELGKREGMGYRLRDAHNEWLALLLQVGVVGAIPFVIGFSICGRSAWKARHASLGLVPMALFVTVFAITFSGNVMIWKQQWLFLALSLTASPKTSPSLRRLPMFRVRQPTFQEQTLSHSISQQHFGYRDGRGLTDISNANRNIT